MSNTPFTPPPLPIVGPKSGFGVEGGNEVYETKEAAQAAAFERALGELALELAKAGQISAPVDIHISQQYDHSYHIPLPIILEHKRYFLEVFKLLINGTPSVVATSSGIGGSSNGSL